MTIIIRSPYFILATFHYLAPVFLLHRRLISVLEMKKMRKLYISDLWKYLKNHEIYI